MEIEQLSPVAEVVKGRRTIREFKRDRVPLELVKQLLQLAAFAPTHGMREPWRVILFVDKGVRTFAKAIIEETYSPEEREKKGSKMYDYYTNIPMHLVVVMKQDPRQKKWEEDFSATSAFIQNFQLLAWEQEIGVVWKTNQYNFDPKFHEAIGVLPGEKIIGTLHIGYFDEVPRPKQRTSIEEKLTIMDSEKH
ncbi:nitroreductase family protein [Alkalihalobacterium bogoriense]|uniref:nitroreductase family protein n=1 Tax=Alkalihalobacterium bogoriense TaxID=246272 RepID=UPI0004792589|nr:nitroreductase [Alkalihalobacterium bogoriense]